jgi:hypothetical protein
MSETNSFPDWNKDNPQESLDAVYGRAIANAENDIEWYQSRKKPSRIRSQWLRFFSIVLAAVGALCPLLDATRIVEIYTGAPSNFALGQWGYVFLAAAAAIVGYDFYFGHSSGWMRFIVTQISIERALKEFQYDWLLLKAQQENNPLNPQIFLQRAKDFTLQIENLKKQETDAWVAEFQTNISQLEKVLKTELEVRKPGSIKVAIKNCADFDKILIRLNDNPVKELDGVSEGIINTVSPGRYEVTVIGKKGEKESKASKVVEVQAGAMTSAEFTLP